MQQVRANSAIQIFSHNNHSLQFREIKTLNIRDAMSFCLSCLCKWLGIVWMFTYSKFAIPMKWNFSICKRHFSRFDQNQIFLGYQSTEFTKENSVLTNVSIDFPISTQNMNVNKFDYSFEAYHYLSHLQREKNQHCCKIGFRWDFDHSIEWQQSFWNDLCLVHYLFIVWCFSFLFDLSFVQASHNFLCAHSYLKNRNAK